MLCRYEARLKDVVRAYKGLAKEKETLETTLKAISAANETEKVCSNFVLALGHVFLLMFKN